MYSAEFIRIAVSVLTDLVCRRVPPGERVAAQREAAPEPAARNLDIDRLACEVVQRELDKRKQRHALFDGQVMILTCFGQ